MFDDFLDFDGQPELPIRYIPSEMDTFVGIAETPPGAWRFYLGDEAVDLDWVRVIDEDGRCRLRVNDGPWHELQGAVRPNGLDVLVPELGEVSISWGGR